MTNRHFVSFGIIALVAGCDPSSGLDPCGSTTDRLSVGGESSGIGGAVSVVVTQAGDRVSLDITPDDDSLVHTAEFTLADADVDDVVGDVTAEVGNVFAGEGSEYGYLRLTDERGVWFEGGRSGFIDDDAQGGTTIDGPFSLGDDSGARCRSAGGTGDGVVVHDVHAAIADRGSDVVVGPEGTDGTWRGVDVRAVGLEASRSEFEEPAGTADGFGPGKHTRVTVRAYLYRARR
jgi:hypothetical protein